MFKVRKIFFIMPVLCDQCHAEMESIKQKYICRNCYHIKPCCEGEVCNEWNL